MAEKVLNSRIVLKHDIEENWLKATGFIPKQGEIVIYDIDDSYTYERFKIGDGVTQVTALPFVSDTVLDNLNLKNGSSVGSLRSVGSAEEGTDILDADGNDTNIDYVIGRNAFAFGQGTMARGECSVAEGYKTQTTSDYAHTEGCLTIAGYQAHAEGGYTEASGTESHAEGDHTTASGDSSHAEGSNTLASGGRAHAEGSYTEATEWCTHAEGGHTKATMNYAHAEGNSTTASGYASHAEGWNTTASRTYSHAEGQSTTASNDASHAEGYSTTASGSRSHAEGKETTASGEAAHTEGISTTASGEAAHAEGYHTIAGSSYQHVEGKYNIEDTSDKYAHVVGNGDDETNRSNAYTLDWNGNAWFKGDVYVGGTDQNDINVKHLIAVDKNPESHQYLVSDVDGNCKWEDKTHWIEGTSNVLLDNMTVTISNYSASVTVENDFVVGQSYMVIWNGTRYICVAYTIPGPNVPGIGSASFVNGTGGNNEPFLMFAYNPTAYVYSQPGTHTFTLAEGEYIIHKLDNIYLDLPSFPKNILDGTAFGSLRQASSAVEGTNDYVIGQNAIAFGAYTKASGIGAHAEGQGTTASGDYSHAEGQGTTTSGLASHAEGQSTTASGFASHTEGNGTKALNQYSHAEGLGTTANGDFSHAEGSGTKTTNAFAHAEGYGATASGVGSHAEGNYTESKGMYSHAEGNYTIANGEYQHVQGKCNIEDANSTYAHIVGNGTSTNSRSNAYVLDWDGNARFAGDVYVQGTGTTGAMEGAKKLATEEYVGTKVAELVNSAPETLDTLNELSAALDNDPNFAATVAAQIGTKVPVTRTINNKSLDNNITLLASDIGADEAGASQQALEDSKTYTNEKIEEVKTNVTDFIEAITEEEIDDICMSTLEVDEVLVDETTGKNYTLYVSGGDLKMMEVG